MLDDAAPLVSIEGLRVDFQTQDGPVTGVHDISFDIRPGECVCVVGESGSGKSVSSLSLMRLVEFGGGEIAQGRLMFDAGKGRMIDLARQPADVMRDALAKGGTSFDSLYVNVNGESGYFDRSLDAYGREGESCRRCGAVMRRDKFMNRSSFYCPRCQPRPRALSVRSGL